MSSYDEDVVHRTKKYAKGNYLFGLESSTQFMSNLIYFDHIGRSYDDIYEYPKKVDLIGQDDLKNKLSDAFNWDNLTIVIVGDPSLKKALQTTGYKVKTHKVEEFL